MTEDHLAITAGNEKPGVHAAKLLGLFILVLLPLYLFGNLAEDVVKKEVFFFDKPVLVYLHQHATPALDSVMIFFTHAGSAMVIVPFNILIFLLLAGRKQWRQSLFWASAVCGAALMNLLAKHAFSRVRPDLWISLLPETTFSFPSGHAMQSMAVGCALVLLLRQSRWQMVMTCIATVFVIAVGISRIYLGVHYPSDILAGWSASFAWVIGLAAAFSHRRYRRNQNQNQQPVQSDRVE